jgi:hypothetical protein
MTGTMNSPCRSFSTSSDRSRFGPPCSPPRRSGPWQPRHSTPYTSRPRVTSAGSPGSRCCAGKVAMPPRPRPPGAGGPCEAGVCAGVGWAGACATTARTVAAHKSAAAAAIVLISAFSIPLPTHFLLSTFYFLLSASARPHRPPERRQSSASQCPGRRRRRARSIAELGANT